MKIPPLFLKKTLTVPTIAGWCAISLVFILCFSGAMITVHPFLAPTRPNGAGGLIIEGWVPDYCFEEAVIRYKKGNYQQILITGGPLESGSYLKEFKTYATLGAATLDRLAIPDSCIVPVPAPHSPVDRTWNSALALKRWLDSSGCMLTTFDLLSQSTHTRRSRLFFRRVLGKRYAVGSIAVKDPDFNHAAWWTSSKEFRQTVDESIAYVYALFFVFSR